MALRMKISYVDAISETQWRFRRRWPKRVREIRGEDAYQKHIKARDGAAFQREYQFHLRNFDAIVEDTLRQHPEVDTRSATQKFIDAQRLAENYMAGVQGLDPDDSWTRGIVGHGLAARGEAPEVVAAVLNPDQEPPKPTLADMRDIYAKDNGLADDRKEMVRIDRTFGRLSDALRKSLDDVTIESIDRLTARAFKDHLLGLKKANGKPLALKSCQREMIIVAAAYRHAVRELEIPAGRDPFERLSWPKEQVSSLDKNVPLPDSVVDAVQMTLEGGRSKDLPDMWRVLKGTGMRLGEACGLRISDVDLKGETPSILITPNEINGIKNSNSDRYVPIASDSLRESLRARVEGRKGEEPLFHSYGRDGGPTAASAALMKAVRKNTDDKRMKVHGLRHRASDKLRDAGAPVEVRHGYLGHSAQSVAENTYGGRDARLREFARWGVKAGL
ncbi:tyrosine-type recombinase/integrase [Ruegeria meonggei]|uniref:Tyrosine recombinase XerC n=1 Tax=Ruegeria meonggei TaxID=1446476 RepID=A0A1X6YSV4_9RHOB|nr:site-specific integrase [Ruegeria meonggei]SLN29814.1 Tyrosine recombinase XerC [Ruegeria meonggei]